jgi:hypothetical protein
VRFNRRTTTFQQHNYNLINLRVNATTFNKLWLFFYQKFKIMNELEKSFSEKVKFLCENLFLMSETDAAIKPIEWKKIKSINSEIVAEKLNQSAENTLEIIAFDDFFTPLTTSQEWHQEAEKANLLRFSELKTFLSEKLTEIQVFKTSGAAKKEVVLLGKNPEGFVAGFKTYVVET